MNLKIKKDDEFVNKKLRKVLFMSMSKMKVLAKRKAPVDTGRLRGSIRLRPRAPNRSEYELVTGVNYGAHIEYGTDPHMPPVSALKDWSRRVLKDSDAAWAIAKKIQKQGTPAQPFFRPALNEVKRKHAPAIYKKVMKE